MTLMHLSPNQVERLYRDGQTTEDEVAEYLRAWNAGPHFNQAVLSDGAIRLFDPERPAYHHLHERFGVRL